MHSGNFFEMKSSLVAKILKKPHAVCIPAPFQSHIIAMLKLAKLLHLKGFHITFVNTEYNHQRILKSRGADSLNGLPEFKFETIPDGLPASDISASQDILSLLKSMARNFLGPFRNVITKLNEASAFSDNPPVTCIVSDVIMGFPLEAAEEFGIPTALLCIVNACALMICLHSQHIERGLLPLKGGDALYNYVQDPIERATNASAIIINTFDALESSVLEAMRTLLPPIYTIGPLQLLIEQLPQNTQLRSIESNIWIEDQHCLQWLDIQELNSVVYVSFGSHTVMTPEQLIEFAWGLANSKHGSTPSCGSLDMILS
ncbi:hypothetical protein IFM89_015791 [Coptis chinensis]|uniref:Uncharacterized protein n=1 Tax=Coptis chinensis TaxID=261450 RepID=A0A835IPG7_9MAGN|nr:hypothetical protein IFM89_015791 [Coptis chinensis]